jgi:Na+/H+ antiporter NhaC
MAGEASRDIAKRYGIYATRSASLLDIFSCVFQGVLPYSAQVLLAASISKLNPMDLIGKVHYCYFLGVATLISIAFGWRQK